MLLSTSESSQSTTSLPSPQDSKCPRIHFDTKWFIKSHLLLSIVNTLGCIMFGLGQKVLSRLAWSKFRPNLASQETLTDFHGNEAKKIFFLKQKIQNGRLKKSENFKTTNSRKIFVKISWNGPWISSIDWCQWHWCGSTYMVWGVFMI